MKNQERKYKENVLFVYYEVKNLFIEAEAYLLDMRIFVTPTTEHIIRHMEMTKDRKASYDSIKQLVATLGYEIRAYFDTADYITISVRDKIAQSLEKISK